MPASVEPELPRAYAKSALPGITDGLEPPSEYWMGAILKFLVTTFLLPQHYYYPTFLLPNISITPTFAGFFFMARS